MPADNRVDNKEGSSMSQTESLSVTELEEAFEIFSRVSHELDTTYRELESKVAGLTDELAKARSAKLIDV